MSQAMISFSDDQLSLIRNTVAKGTTPDQFKLFIEVCRYHGLNPFARQIYAVVRSGQMTIQTSIDGYRLLAERSGKYAGQMGPQWCDDSGEWKDVWLKDSPPSAARVGVLRTGFAHPIWGVAKFKSYAQPQSPTWTKMPDVMLAKCAESLALRKAFPAEMSGIYTKDEMEQADEPLPTIEHPSAPIVDSTVVAPLPGEVRNTPETDENVAATEQQLSSIRKLCERLGKPEPETPASFIAAKELIGQLTAEYRKDKPTYDPNAQPAKPQPVKATEVQVEPSPAPDLRDGAAPTEGQLSSIRNLCKLTNTELAGGMPTTYGAAVKLINTLNDVYKKSRVKK